jgi:hypothetical protein
MAQNTSAEKILTRFKGLRAQMREGEQPLFSAPAIWENATDRQTNACDLVLTNQRLFGFFYKTFPRERLFLDALELSAITAVSIRRKSFEALFRELLVADNQKRIYIRATGTRIEETYTALRKAIAAYAPAVGATLAPATDAHEWSDEQESMPGGTTSDVQKLQGEQIEAQSQQQHEQESLAGPVYSEQRVHQPLERSPLGITLLLVGGLILEIIGVLAWSASGNAQVGVTLILTGLFAVIMAIVVRRQLRRG